MSRRERQRRRQRSRGGAGRVVLLMIGLLTAVGAIGALSAVGWVVTVARSAPSIDSLQPKDPGQNSVVYASDGKTRLGIIQARILRKTIPSTSIPDVMKQATVAIEDKRFYRHQGVDFEGVVRAAFKNVQSEETVQGGSTLTMQLIKNLYTEDRSRDGVEGYKRKIREGRLAEELENVHSGPEGKNWILTKYINSVPYGTVGGQEAVGIQAAARVYFNKRAADLTLPEAGAAGRPAAGAEPVLPVPLPRRPRGPPGPGPARDAPDGRDHRRRGAEAAASEPGAGALDVLRQAPGELLLRLRAQGARRGLRRETVKRGGLRVYTTINLKRQKQARAAIAKHLAAPGSPSSALVSMDPKTGHIKAMASSSNYGDSKFNLAAQGKRQPGSTFKIMALMTALRRNVDLNRTSYVSKKLLFKDPKWGPIDVQNTEGGESGRSKSLFQATVSSDNTVFQQLALDLGPEAVADTAKDMGSPRRSTACRRRRSAA
jgi:penicillin-binding protein 1A